MKKLQATVNMALGLVASASVINGVSSANFVLGTASIVQGALLGLSAGYRHKKYDLSMRDYSGGAYELSCEVGEAIAAITESRQATEIGKQVVKVSPGPLRYLLEAGKEKALDRFNQLFNDFNRGSAIFAGSRGSGKSATLRYAVAKRMLKNPQTQLIIVDPHYDPDESIWLPGMTPEEHKAFVIRGANQGLEAIRGVFEEGERRERDNDKSKPPILCVIDEYQLVVDVTEAGEDLGRIIQQSMNRFRKYGIDFYLGLHSLKLKNTSIDSSALSQMGWLILGNLVNDTNTILPGNWNRKELSAHRERLGKYGAILCPVDRSPEAVSLPNLPEKFKQLPSMSIVVTEPEKYLSIHRHDFEEKYQEGNVSARSLSMALGIQRVSNNPEYEAIKLFISEKKGA